MRLFSTFLLMFLLFQVSLLKSAVLSSNPVFSQINTSHGLSDNQIRYILQLDDGRMVFATNGSFNLYDGVSFSYIQRSSEHIFPLEPYRGHYRLYLSEDSILWMKDNGKLMAIDLNRQQYKSNLKEYLHQLGVTEEILDVFVDSKRRLWVLTVSGVHCPGHGMSINIEHAEHAGLQDLLTRDENLFLFFDSGLLVCYNLKTEKELYRREAYPADQTRRYLNTSLVVVGNAGVFQLRNGTHGGLFFFDTERLIWEQLLDTEYRLNTLIFTANDEALVSSPFGLWRIDRDTHNKQYYPQMALYQGEVMDTEISTIFYDKQGALWVGTFNRGLLYFHPQRHSIKSFGRAYFTGLNTWRDIIVFAFAEDEDGSLYLRTNRGIYRLCFGQDVDIVLFEESPAKISANVLQQLNKGHISNYLGTRVTGVLEDSRGWTWIGTDDGLILNHSDGTVRNIHRADGLVNNSIRGMIEDEDRNIWISTSFGLSRMKVDSLASNFTIQNFKAEDGTIDGEYAVGAVFKTSEGKLLFGGVNGFSTVFPSTIKSAVLPHKPLLSGLYVRGEKIVPSVLYDDNLILANSLAFTNKITLTHKQNFITFEFSAVNYLNPHQTGFRYKLDGFDSDWQTATSEGNLRVTYTNIPSGNYVFRVQSSTDNSYGEEETKLYIRILTPWWRTKLAYVLYVLLLAATVGVIFYVYVRNAERKREIQHKEEMLLMRIRILIEQLNLVSGESSGMSDNKEKAFISRAVELVDRNLHVPDYSVEQLSKDMCMDRTGLYRKLTNILDQSPSLFIRSIRLHRAAQLLSEGYYSVTEISEKVGFGSVSYFSKCFQEAYGCRPSEYAGCNQKST